MSAAIKIPSGTGQAMFVGLSHTSRVNSLHVVMVNQRAENRLYARTSAFGKETGVIWITAQFFVHFIVQWFVDAVIQFLELRDLSAAFRP